MLPVHKVKHRCDEIFSDHFIAYLSASIYCTHACALCQNGWTHHEFCQRI